MLLKDGKWIAAGSFWGDVMVWDTNEIFGQWRIDDVIRGVGFLSHSSHWATTATV
jgi:hypothetical protein